MFVSSCKSTDLNYHKHNCMCFSLIDGRGWEEGAVFGSIMFRYMCHLRPDRQTADSWMMKRARLQSIARTPDQAGALSRNETTGSRSLRHIHSSVIVNASSQSELPTPLFYHFLARLAERRKSTRGRGVCCVSSSRRNIKITLQSQTPT